MSQVKIPLLYERMQLGKREFYVTILDDIAQLEQVSLPSVSHNVTRICSECEMRPIPRYHHYCDVCRELLRKFNLRQNHNRWRVVVKQQANNHCWCGKLILPVSRHCAKHRGGQRG